MASISSLRLRRSEAQLHALAGVEREIRVNDPNGRRKYLQDFSQAFQSYESVIDRQQLSAEVRRGDIVLIGDYHALPAAQRFAATLLEERAQPGDRPVVLGLETPVLLPAPASTACPNCKASRSPATFAACLYLILVARGILPTSPGLDWTSNRFRTGRPAPDWHGYSIRIRTHCHT